MDNCNHIGISWISNIEIKVDYGKNPKLRELSFLVYGLGLSGRSTIKYFKKNKLKKINVWDDRKKKYLKIIDPKALSKVFK